MSTSDPLDQGGTEATNQRSEKQEPNATSEEGPAQLPGEFQNLLAATGIATLFLDRNLHILHFTPRVGELFNIRLTDRGRPLADLTHRLGYDNLMPDARQVLDQLTPIEREVEDEMGKWYLTRVTPYRSAEDRIVGVVITFVEITSRREMEEELRAAKVYAESIIETLHEPLLVLTPDLRVQSANPAFYEHFQAHPKNTEGHLIYELGNNQWDIPELRTLLEDVLPDSNVFNDYEVTHEFEDIGERVMLLNARRLDHVQLILLGIRDITERKLAEEARHASETRYRTLFESIDEGFCIIEVLFDGDEPVDYRFVETNPAFEKQTGLKDASGKRMRDLEPEHESFWFETYGRIAQTGEAARFVQRAANLGDRIYDVYAFRVGQPDEHKVAILFRDISARQKTEDALLASEERYRVLVESAREYAMLMLDTDGKITAWNTGAERIFGYSEQDVLGRPGALLFTEEDRAAGIPEEEMETAIRESKASDDRWHVRQDGSLFWANGVMEALRNENGQVYGFAKVLRDNTRRKEYEDAIRASEERYRTLFESIDEGFAVLQLIFEDGGKPIDFRWIETNPAFERHTGLTDAVGKTVRVLVPDIEEYWIRSYGRVALSGRSEHFEEYSEAMDRWHEVNAFRVGEPEERKVGLLLRDISKRKETEEALLQFTEMLEIRVQERTQQVRDLASRLTMSEQEERRRISQILHDDLQQVLYAVEMRINMIREDLEGTEHAALVRELKEAHDWLTQAVATTRQLTVDLSPPILENEGLADMLWWLETQMHDLHQLKVVIESEHNWFIPDEDLRVLLFQIVRELLFNVKKHAGVNKVAVQLEEVAGRLVIHVIDSGKGFDVEATLSDEECGTGFGLFSVRERLDLLGGQLVIRSQPGQGTHIEIHTPVHATPPTK